MHVFSMPDQYKLQEMGAFGMPLRHALLAIGVSDADLDGASNNYDARLAHRTGALRLAKELTAVMTQEALSGNVSAAKLLMNNSKEEVEKVPEKEQWQRELAKTKLRSITEIVRGVDESFARMKRLHEEAEAEGLSQ